jgi:2-keto-4-pentenoate hydratase/2-oxohepta-3-ene-1,7-dioic acid hydratase in catechol pathway
MKFVMAHPRADDAAHLGVLMEDDSIVDVTSLSNAPPFARLTSLIEAGEAALHEVKRMLARPRTHIPRDQYRLGAPIPRPTQFRDSMCFFQHIEQCATARRPENAAAYELPDIYRQQPVYYIGNRLNVAAPGQDIPWPRHSKMMDFELELACVIGSQCKNLTADNALDHVFGFTIFNDFSARDVQAKEMEGRLGPANGKHFDCGNVFGPCVVTTDEIGDPQSLRMIARVNGQTWCDNTSATMNWTFAQLLAHVSSDTTLYPGEVIASGTVGNGCGLEHSRFLKDGDVVELEVEKIGVLRNRVVQSRGI